VGIVNSKQVFCRSIDARLFTIQDFAPSGGLFIAAGFSVGQKFFSLCPNGNSRRVIVAEPEKPSQQSGTGTTQ
jgi:hypothetical protein